MADSLILMVLALVVFGPRRLPLIGRQIGKLMYEFRKASNDFKFQMEEELRMAEEADRRKKEEEARLLAPAAPALAAGTTKAVSQASDTGLQAGAAAESFDPYEAIYPSPAPPVIQPPSTGEQVLAARPWSLEAELEKLPGASADELAAENRAGETTPAAEQAAHHG